MNLDESILRIVRQKNPGTAQLRNAVLRIKEFSNLCEADVDDWLTSMRSRGLLGFAGERWFERGSPPSSPPLKEGPAPDPRQESFKW